VAAEPVFEKASGMIQSHLSPFLLLDRVTLFSRNSGNFTSHFEYMILLGFLGFGIED
jgi:hypothetical protein